MIEGIKTNIPMHRDVILADDKFVHEAQNIHYLERELLTANKDKADSESFYTVLCDKTIN